MSQNPLIPSQQVQPPLHAGRVADYVVARVDRELIARELSGDDTMGAQVMAAVRRVAYSLAEVERVAEAAVADSEMRCRDLHYQAALEGLVVLEREPAELLAAVVRELDRGTLVATMRGGRR